MIRRVFVACLLLILFVLCASTARAADPKPRRTIGICFHPHGPQHHRWSYLPGGSLVTGKDLKLALELVPEMPLYYFDPRASPENQKLLRKLDPRKPCEPAPPVKAPAPPPVAKSKPPPPKKKEVEEGGGDSGGSGDKAASIEERVEKKRIRSEDPPEEARRSPPPPQGVLSKEPQLPRESGILSKEGVLPSRDEVRPPRCVDEQCAMVDRGGALPEIQHRQGRPLVSVVPCGQTKEGCKGEAAGDGTGKAKPLTPLERMVRELSIASAMLNGEFNHDLARKDGKRFGIIGGSSEDGVDSAIVQAAAAIAQVASGVLVGQAETFAKKLEEACAKKAPLIIEGAEELSKETAELLAKQYGEDIAHGLEQNGAIGAYEVMREFTRGLEGSYQAHHILEKAMGREFGLTKKQLDKLPSVILTEAQHKRITNALNEARKRLPPTSKENVWKVYEEVYAPHQHWLDAIKPYFGK
ncbi:hypothetical protein [Polyangium spumosum]|uniref:Uncharacterized protein n=1 Tax=Polyangium spumosum TaxID=889282 RepID=A0A6N7PGL1_9BACT|nr:hypothetical protein [Polyangium spumosum]MRG91139.1 hypothetical protein [Polyangium spumosum]